MFSLHVSIANPWAKENFKNLWHTHGSITKHKHWEFEFIRHAYSLFEVHIGYSIRQDHAGLKLHFALLGYSIDLSIYDGRHWNTENDCWEIYTGENDE
jgi:hypothetical protein